ncbi:MAG: hypothetical protein M1834_001110 [Cirrosporium novae-zelandiae]|nr:MAG: hypothetical protein M1834_001110 [Cirrosporium novae-zelandiae]
MLNFTVYVKKVNREGSAAIETSRMDTVYDLKKKVEAKMGIRTEEQRLIAGGYEMRLRDDDGYEMTVGDYELEHGSAVHFALRLHGGASQVITVKK